MITIKYNVTGTMEVKKEDLDKVQKEYQKKLDEYEEKIASFAKMEAHAMKEKTALPDIFQARVNRAGTALLTAERKFKDKVNLLIAGRLPGSRGKPCP